MKRPSLIKTLLPAALALVLTLPAAAYAAEQKTSPGTDGAASPKRAIEMKQKREAVAKRIGAMPPARGHQPVQGKLNLIANPANQHKYLELLAEKYLPAALADWKAALAEQNSLREQMRALLKDQGVQEALQGQKKQQQERIKQLQEQAKAKRDELKATVESGELTKEQAERQLKSRTFPFAGLPGKFKSALPAGVAPAAKDALKHRQALTEAVKADDAEAIGAALALLLQDLQKSNEQAAERMNELKAKANGQVVEQKAPKQ